jgi:hypothetical protein
MPNEVFEISKHASEQLLLRKISEELIFTVLHFPDKVLKDVAGITIYQKMVNDRNIPYLYRVFVNADKNPSLVVTAYKTSKFKKYEN